MKNKLTETQLFRDIMLVATAIIWGSGFPLTNLVVTSGVTPILFIAIRFLLGAFIVGVVLRRELPFVTQQDVRLGVIAGLLLGLSFIIQTYGLMYTSTSNNAFLTSSNVIMVPFLSWFVFHQRPPTKIIILAALCFVGMGILSWSPDLEMGLNFGDLLTILSALGFASHIAFLGYATSKVKSTATLNFLQLLTSGVLGASAFLAVEMASFSYQPSMKVGFLACILLAVVHTSICFFVQTWVQRHSPPARVAVILSLEGVFGSLLAVMVGYDAMTWRLFFGGSIVAMSIMMTEVNFARMIENFKIRTEKSIDEQL